MANGDSPRFLNDPESQRFEAESESWTKHPNRTRIVDRIRSSDDAESKRVTAEFAAEFKRRTGRDYPQTDREWRVLLAAVGFTPQEAAELRAKFREDDLWAEPGNLLAEIYARLQPNKGGSDGAVQSAEDGSDGDVPPTDKPTTTYSSADLAKELGVCGKTLNRYAKGAKVKTPKTGGRNHRYSAADRVKILEVAANGSEKVTAERAENLLKKSKEMESKPTNGK